MRRVLVLIGILASLLGATPAGAHDPSAFGGLFRSRNFGGTWLNADVGLFLNAVLTVAIDPHDPNHLLMGTDVGIFASRNGGRSWTPEAQGLIAGAVFAIAFTPDGQSVLSAAPGSVFRFLNGQWEPVRAPDDATPARAIAFGSRGGRIYLLGRERLFVSDDHGRSFAPLDGALPATGQMTALSVATSPREVLLAVMDGRAMTSEDEGRRWQLHPIRLPGSDGELTVDTAVQDSRVPGRVWAGARDRIWVSDHFGADWRMLAGKLPEADTNIRGIAADATASTLVVTTHRGMYRSEDGGQHWGFMESRLPIHLESGPLVRDPTDAKTLYAMYSLMPYPEVWRTAVVGSNLISRLDWVGVAGGVALVLLILILGGLLAFWLARLRATTGPKLPPAQLRPSR
ncbi:MAG: hypothetical protein JO047_02040 [Alphaproteobacteria bacterium]|nr:hypothetical protein [Alphaproteobacteria bacterium]